MRQLSFMLALLLLGACANVTGTTSDSQAAQQLLPRISGYHTGPVDSIVSALTAAGAGAALTSGNPVAAAAIARTDAVVSCLRNSGAVGGQTYTQATPSGIIPEAGVVFVINQTRVNQNLLGCLLSGQQPEAFSAQAVEIRPCAETGNFRYEGNDYTYIYVGLGDRLCGFFAQHFNNLK